MFSSLSEAKASGVVYLKVAVLVVYQVVLVNVRLPVFAVALSRVLGNSCFST